MATVITTTDIQSRYYTNGSSSCNFTAAKDGFYTIAGRGYTSTNYYNTVVKFVLNSPATKLNFTLSHTNSDGADAVLNYKFVSSADYSESSSLNSATYTTTGDGTITVDGGSGSWYATTYSFDGSFSAGTWYLYLWTSLSGSTNWCRIRHTTDNPIKLTYEQGGVVRIGDGSVYGTYAANIGNGSSFDTYLAYVGDGTNWNPYTG